MGKIHSRKRVALILIASFLLFAAAAIFISLRETEDERIAREVRQIAGEFGFEFKEQIYNKATTTRRPSMSTIFMGPPIDAGSRDELIERLRNTCPSFRHTRYATDEEQIEVAETVSNPWREVHFFRPVKNELSEISVIAFCPNERGHTNSEGKPEASLGLHMNARQSLWARVKGLWPW